LTTQTRTPIVPTGFSPDRSYFNGPPAYDCVPAGDSAWALHSNRPIGSLDSIILSTLATKVSSIDSCTPSLEGGRYQVLLTFAQDFDAAAVKHLVELLETFFTSADYSKFPPLTDEWITTFAPSFKACVENKADGLFTLSCPHPVSFVGWDRVHAVCMSVDGVDHIKDRVRHSLSPRYLTVAVAHHHLQHAVGIMLEISYRFYWIFPSADVRVLPHSPLHPDALTLDQLKAGMHVKLMRSMPARPEDVVKAEVQVRYVDERGVRPVPGVGFEGKSLLNPADLLGLVPYGDGNPNPVWDESHYVIKA
jgi:hypothetical protein